MTALSRSLAAALAAAGLALGCTAQEPKVKPSESAAAKAKNEEADLVAVVNGREISLQELETWLKDDLYKQQTEGKNAAAIYDLRSDGLERMITDQLVTDAAKSQGLTVEQLMKLETDKAPPVDDAAVQKFYDENKARLAGQTFEQIGPRIRQHLEQQAKQDAWQKYVQGLRDAAGVEIKLVQPRIQVAADGATRGPADAPVTIIEFSDYQCPFCRKAEPVVREVLARYPDKVRFVYRHFPLEMHQRARPAAEAASCAAEQNKFWEYHEKLFAGDKLTDADLESYAQQVGLDVPAFQKCREDGHTRPKIDADFAAGRAAGVTGTPAFFVNGLMISGAQPVDEFVRRIESELKTAKTPAAPHEG